MKKQITNFLSIFAILAIVIFPVASFAKDGVEDDFDHPEDEFEMEMHKNQRGRTSGSGREDKRPMAPYMMVQPEGMNRDQSYKEKREAIKEEYKASREEMKEKHKALIEEMKDKRESLSGEDRKTFEEMVKERRENLKNEIEQKKEQLKADIAKLKSEKPTIRKAFVEQRFSMIIKGLDAHLGRVETKIDELKGDGYNMDEANTHLDASQKALGEAKTLLASLTATTVSDTSEASVKKPREIAQKIEVALKSAKDHLIQAITSIKKGVAEKDDSSDDDAPDTDEDN